MAPGNDIMAQAVFLAQLEASKSKCECRACKILRRASEMMTDQFLATASPAPRETVVSPNFAEILKVGEEDK